MAFKRKRSSSSSRRVRRKLFKGKRRGPRGRRAALRKNPFPTSVVVRMRYSGQCENAPSAAAIDDYTFRANSIFDPDYTGAGHQPYGHDQYQMIYNHYKVIKSKITVTFISTSVTQTGSAVCGIAIKDDTTMEQNLDTIREAKGSRYGILPAGGKLKLTLGYNMKIMYPEIFQAATAMFGANPTEDAFFQVFSGPISGVITPATVSCIVTIDYTVKCWELKDLGQS